MAADKWKYLDEHLRVRLADLNPRQFELFFLDFLGAGISLSIEKHGREETKRVIAATTYAAGSGHRQDGVDLHVTVEGGEIWAFQCKREKKWSLDKTRTAIEEARFQANHYFLVVASDPPKSVYDEMRKYPNWTFWNLDKICSELKHRVHPSKHVQVLSFLPPEELKRFVPFTTESLVTPQKFFERFLGADKLFRHDWKLVGRESELQALSDFIKGPHKVQVLSAKGGDGKSRLLWELCRTLATEAPETEVLCLNPHRDGDEFSFAFTGNPPHRVVLVDDAHRAEQLPMQLLALVREDSGRRATKVVLATRPQGVEALAHKLYEAGLANDLAPQLSLGRLKKSDIKALAFEALGEKQRDRAPELAELTADCPFLTVIAGELLRSDRLEWGKWASHEEFRQHVFREFEQKNLETVPEADRKFASGLMRMLALLAPVVVDAWFPEKAARSLDCSVFELETQLNRLRQSELAAGRDDGLRIVPDLFADFLVYDTCYGPNKLPGFANKVVSEFDDSSAALLRNLSEATWIANANGVADETLLDAVLELERRRFEGASFHKRAEMLRHWSGFSVYLPAESLELARSAIALKTAPIDQTQQVLGALGGCDHAYVCAQIPALLKPIANYHDQHRDVALNLLWELGRTKSWTGDGPNQNHPWAVIADVIKFEPKKCVSVTLDALAWLDAQLQQPGTLEILEGPTPVLRALIGPCFERSVEFSWWEGRTCHFCRQAVSVPNTQPIRDRALAILLWVIEHGSSLAALDALSALQMAIRRVTRFEATRAGDESRLRAEWLPERLKALGIYEKAIERHSSVTVRYEIRQTLKRDLAYEEDSTFVEERRRVLAKIPDDLALGVAVAILSQGAFQFAEEAGVLHDADQYKKEQARWSNSVRDTARRLAALYPSADVIFDFLQRLAQELTLAGKHLCLAPLFGELAHVAPSLAEGLADHILDVGSGTPLVREWPELIEKNRQISDGKKIGLFRKAAGNHRDASAAVVRVFLSRALENKAFEDAEKGLLLEIAQRAEAEEGDYLLQIVKWSGDANLPTALKILGALPIRDIAPGMLGRVLEALAPYRQRKSDLPSDLVHHVLMQLVGVRDLGLFHHSREWDVLTGKYPRSTYELLRERIAYSAAGKASDDYCPVPRGFRRGLDLSSLTKEIDYPQICDDLWDRVVNPSERETPAWIRLFQKIVFENASLWRPRMLDAITSAASKGALSWLTQLLRFEGSLIIFHFPEITSTFLRRALALGGNQLFQQTRVDLYSGCGPETRSYSNGVLDKELDYVEAEAIKAAEANASDELLGPFYRWIAEVEQKERLVHKMQSDSAMASLD